MVNYLLLFNFQKDIQHYNRSIITSKKLLKFFNNKQVFQSTKP